MSKNVVKKCLICRKQDVSITVDSNGDYDTGFGSHRAVCKDASCQKVARLEYIEKPRLEREARESENASVREKQIREELSTHMKTGQSLIKWQSSWENHLKNNKLPEDVLNLCREYEKNIEEKERLMKGEDEEYDDSNNDDNTQKKCGKCGSSEVKYEHESANDGKKFCSQTCFGDYYRQKNNNDSNNSPNQSPNSPFSPNNTPSEIPSNNNSPADNSSPKEYKPKLLLIAGTKKEVMDYAKKLIREGSEVEDIRTDSLTSSEISELIEFEKNNLHNAPKPVGKTVGLLHNLKPFLIGGLVLIPIIIIIVVVSRKKRKTRR